MDIGDFVPGRGYRVFVPEWELVQFRFYIANADAQQKQLYSLNSGEERSEGGGVYFLGLHCTEEDMQKFKKDWILGID
jgi:hypothetical protein